MSSELRIAAKEGRVDVIAALLAQGTPVDATDSRGWTALMLAAKYGQKTAVQTLLDAGADVNAGHVGGRTAFVQAVERGCAEIVQMLLERGANMDVRGDGGRWLAKVSPPRQESELAVSLRQVETTASPEETNEMGKQWTIAKPFARTVKYIIDGSGPPSFCMFDVTVSPAPECEGVTIELAGEADMESVTWYPHLCRGMLRGVEIACGDGRELVGIRVVVHQIYTHDIATTESACEIRGRMFIDELLRYAVRLPEEIDFVLTAEEVTRIATAFLERLDIRGWAYQLGEPRLDAKKPGLWNIVVAWSRPERRVFEGANILLVDAGTGDASLASPAFVTSAFLHDKRSGKSAEY
jgi:hypothetical protein